MLKIHGEETAQKWKEIKEFGKTSFMDWQATGTSSFMQKEVLTNKIRAFAEFALSNPMTAQKIDVTELLQQTWDVMEIGRESPILDEQKGLPPEIQQKMGGMEEQIHAMGAALNEASKQVDKLEETTHADAEKRRVEAYKAETARLQLILPYLPPEAIAAIAHSVGLQAVQTDDILPPQAAMPPEQPPPEAAPTETQPPEGGFLTPEAQ
jgi:hypothetical protein